MKKVIPKEKSIEVKVYDCRNGDLMKQNTKKNFLVHVRVNGGNK